MPGPGAIRTVPGPGQQPSGSAQGSSRWLRCNPAGTLSGMNTSAPSSQAGGPDVDHLTTGHTQSSPALSPETGRKTLSRSRRGRMLAGVASGIARYVGVDVTIVRIAFVLVTLVGGIGIPLYLASWLL